MSFQVIVREIKRSGSEPVAETKTEQIFEQTVPELDLRRVIDAVNFKKRERKPRVAKTGQ